MTELEFIIGFTIAAALTSALLLVPLARLIPLHMMKQWRELMIDNGHQPASPLLESDFTFSMSDKLGMCVVGGLIGLLASSTYPQMTDAVAIGGYLLCIVLLVAINLKHLLLPDQVVLTVLWVGLLRGVATAHGVDYVLGAAVGYAAPLMLFYAIKMVSGKWVLGYGDLKTLAMAGAWFGIASLPLIFAVFFGTTILMLVADAVFKRSRTLGTGSAHLAASLACVLAGA